MTSKKKQNGYQCRKSFSLVFLNMAAASGLVFTSKLCFQILKLLYPFRCYETRRLIIKMLILLNIK